MDAQPHREIAPVAIFDTVEIDGCAVSRASLHNLSFIENLELAPGCRIKVSKRNQIIPHVEENLDRNCYSRDKVVPARCPCCGQPTRIHMTKNTVNGLEKVTAALFCDNEHCETRKLRKFVHFASPKALNIMGLSESIWKSLLERVGFTPIWTSLLWTSTGRRSYRWMALERNLAKSLGRHPAQPHYHL